MYFGRLEAGTAQEKISCSLVFQISNILIRYQCLRNTVFTARGGGGGGGEGGGGGGGGGNGGDGGDEGGDKGSDEGGDEGSGSSQVVGGGNDYILVAFPLFN